MVVELDEQDRALDAVVERVVRAMAADPAEMGVGEMALERLHLRGARAVGHDADIGLGQVHQPVAVGGGERAGEGAFIGHHTVVLMRAAQHQAVGEMDATVGQVLSGQRAGDMRRVALVAGQCVHQGEALQLMVVEQLDAFVRPMVRMADLGAHEAGRQHHLAVDREAAHRQMVAPELPSPGIGRGRFAEDREIVAPAVQHAGGVQHQPEKGVEPHHRHGVAIAAVGEAGRHHRHGPGANFLGGVFQPQPVLFDEDLGVLPAPPDRGADLVAGPRPLRRGQRANERGRGLGHRGGGGALGFQAEQAFADGAVGGEAGEGLFGQLRPLREQVRRPAAGQSGCGVALGVMAGNLGFAGAGQMGAVIEAAHGSDQPRKGAAVKPQVLPRDISSMGAAQEGEGGAELLGPPEASGGDGLDGGGARLLHRHAVAQRRGLQHRVSAASVDAFGQHVVDGDVVPGDITRQRL